MQRRATGDVPEEPQGFRVEDLDQERTVAPSSGGKYREQYRAPEPTPIRYHL